MIHAFQLLFIDCNYPKAFVWWIGMHAIMFYYLFSDFYKQEYLKKEARKKVSATHWWMKFGSPLTQGMVHGHFKKTEFGGGGREIVQTPNRELPGPFI